MWHKALPTYRYSGVVYIQFNTGHPDMVGKWEVVGIGVQLGVTNGVAKVKLIKIIIKLQTKSVKILQYTLQHKSMHNP